MKKSSSILTILSTALIVLGVVVSSFLTDYSSEISSVVTTITAVIGAVALYIQFKKDKAINQANFIVEFHKSFYENPQNAEIKKLLDMKANGKNIDCIKDEKYAPGIVSYISWLKTLCTLLEKNTVSYEAVDELFGYKFFTFTNGVEIQEVELVPYAEYSEIIYKVHRKWSEYKKKHNKKIIFEETSLALTKDYAKYSK